MANRTGGDLWVTSRTQRGERWKLLTEEIRWAEEQRRGSSFGAEEGIFLWWEAPQWVLISDSLEGRMRVRRKNVISLGVLTHMVTSFQPHFTGWKISKIPNHKGEKQRLFSKNSSGPRKPGLLLGVFIAHAENEDESTMLELGSRCCRVACSPQSIKPMLTWRASTNYG